MLSDRITGSGIKASIQNQVSYLNQMADSFLMDPVDFAGNMLQYEGQNMLDYMSDNGITPIDPNNTTLLATQISKHIVNGINGVKNDYADNAQTDYMGENNGPYSNTDASDEYFGGQHRMNAHTQTGNANYYGQMGMDNDYNNFDVGSLFDAAGAAGNDPNADPGLGLLETDYTDGSDPITTNTTSTTNNSSGDDDTSTAFGSIGSLLGPILTVGGGVLNNVLQGQNLQKQQQLIKQQGLLSQINAKTKSTLSSANTQNIIKVVAVVFGFVLLIVIVIAFIPKKTMA